MGRAICCHCRHVHFHSSIFFVAGDQFPCTGVGSVIIRCLVIDSFFGDAVDLRGYGLRYASMPNFHFFYTYCHFALPGSIFIFITSSTPNPHSLGATNGLAQTTVSIARAIGPALSTSLFSFSLEKNILGGFGVYVALATLSVFAVYLATRLPPKPWDENESMQIDTDDR